MKLITWDYIIWQRIPDRDAISKQNLTQELKKVKTFLGINGYKKNIIKSCHKIYENIRNNNSVNNCNVSSSYFGIGKHIWFP